MAIATEVGTVKMKKSKYKKMYSGSGSKTWSGSWSLSGSRSTY